MKTLKNILAIALFTGGATLIAQEPPAPPAPPSPPSTVYEDDTTTVTTNSSNVSIITQSGDYGRGGNTSFSVSSSDDEYRVKSRYPENRYPAVKDFLIRELGSKNMQSSGTDMVWKLEADQGTVYSIDLSKTRLKIELDKQFASSDLEEKFEDMGNILRTLISGGNERQEVSRLERDADRARRDAQRMQREAARLQAMSARDAARLSQQAALLEQEAAKLSLVSKRGGGIDGYVRDVLRQPSTLYKLNTTGNSGWKWPVMQNALLKALKKDKLITGEEDIVFIKEDSGIYVNGEKLNPSAWSSYNNLFRKYDYASMGDVSFYKQGNHIAVVTSALDLEDTLEAVKRKGLLNSISKEVRIEINGVSTVIDGRTLSQNETETWNEVLHKQQVIPAPGKTIIIGKDFASMGYSFDKSTLGTWISRD